jgi:hypothetical protein
MGNAASNSNVFNEECKSSSTPRGASKDDFNTNYYQEITVQARELARDGVSVEDMSARLGITHELAELYASSVKLSPKVGIDVVNLVSLRVMANTYRTSLEMLSTQVNKALEDEETRQILLQNLVSQVAKYSDPLTKVIITDPVIAADKQTYKRSSINHWASSSRQSPLDSSVCLFDSSGLLILEPNSALSTEVSAWLEGISYYVVAILRLNPPLTQDQIESLCQVLACYSSDKYTEYLQLLCSCTADRPQMLQRLLWLLPQDTKRDVVEMLLSYAQTSPNLATSTLILLHSLLTTLDPGSVDRVVTSLSQLDFSNCNVLATTPEFMEIFELIKRRKGLSKAHGTIQTCWVSGFKSPQVTKELIDLSVMIEADVEPLIELCPQLLEVAVDRRSMNYAERLLQVLLLNSPDLDTKLRYTALMPSIEPIFSLVQELLIVNHRLILEQSSPKLVLLMLEAVHLEKTTLPQIYKTVKEVLTKEQLDQVIAATTTMTSFNPDTRSAIEKELTAVKQQCKDGLVSDLESVCSQLVSQINELQAHVVRQLAHHNSRFDRLEAQVKALSSKDVAGDLARLEGTMQTSLDSLHAGVLSGFTKVSTDLASQSTTVTQLRTQVGSLEARVLILDEVKAAAQAEMQSLACQINDLRGFVETSAILPMLKIAMTQTEKEDLPLMEGGHDRARELRSAELGYEDRGNVGVDLPDCVRGGFVEEYDLVFTRGQGSFRKWFVEGPMKKELTTFSLESPIVLTGLGLGNAYTQGSTVCVEDLEIRDGAVSNSPLKYRHPAPIQLSWDGSEASRFIKVPFSEVVPLTAFNPFTIRVGYRAVCVCWGCEDESAVVDNEMVIEFRPTYTEEGDLDNGNGGIVGPIMSLFYRLG